MNENPLGAGLTAFYQGLGAIPQSADPSVWVFIAFPLLLLLAAWKLPAATQSPSFFSSGACIAGYFLLTGIVTWIGNWRSKPDTSTLGFLLMLQYFTLGGAILFFIHSLRAGNRTR